MLDDPIRKQSMVLVTGMIPAGCRVGDPISVRVALPDAVKRPVSKAVTSSRAT